MLDPATALTEGENEPPRRGLGNKLLSQFLTSENLGTAVGFFVLGILALLLGAVGLCIIFGTIGALISFGVAMLTRSSVHCADNMTAMSS